MYSGKSLTTLRSSAFFNIGIIRALFKRDDGPLLSVWGARLTGHCLRWDGPYVGIEVKAAKGKQSDHQNLELAGGRYILAYSLGEVLTAL